MLSKIREKVQGIIAAVILAFVGIPFALWGINSYFDTGPGTHVARVNDSEISQQAYRAALEPLRGRVDPATMETRAFKEMVLSGLVEQTLLLRDAEESGYRMSDERLARLIREAPIFQRDGRFDPEQYRAVLRREGMGEREFENRLRGENLARQVQLGLTESGIVTEAEITQAARLLAQQREVAHVVVSAEKFLAGATVSDTEIESRYEAQAARYQTPEQARVQYVRLSAADLVKNYSPGEEDLRRAYEQESARYVTPEKRRVAHILVELAPAASDGDVKKAQARAQDLARQLKGGADFAALARKHSDDKDSGAKGGDLGEVKPDVLPKTVETAALALKSGQVSEPVRTEYGFHLVKVTALTPEKRKPLADAKPELVKLLQARAGEERFIEAAEKLRNLVYENPDSLAPAANTLELEIQESGWFTRVGGTGIAAHPKVAEAAFQPEIVNKSRNSDPVELDAQTLVALRVIEHKPAARRPLAEVRAEIVRDLRQEAAQRAARAAATGMLEELRGGASLEAVAKKHNLKLEPAKKVTREQGALSRLLLEAAFRAPRPDGGNPVYELVELGREGVALIALKAAIEPEADKIDAATRERAKRMLAERRGAGYYGAYRAGLRQKAEVKIFEDRL
jgi:peptidyl-prolyl cis-trans isomerase D